MLGIPGAGKGTQAKKISQKFNIIHISTGDILRNEIKKETLLGVEADEYLKKGKLVPDDVIIEIIKSEISRDESRDGFLMDGFPRNLKQAVMFSNILDELELKLDKVINIIVDKNEIIKRLDSRRVCTGCKRIYSFNNFGDKNIVKCPHCGGKLIKRKDDSADIIKKRFTVYEKETKPLINYYEDKNLLVNIDGMGTEQEVTERILNCL